MKIGIVTQSLRVNYGGLLQNYALQEVLRNRGHEAVTIDQPCLNEKYYRILLSAVKTLLLKAAGRGGKRRLPIDISVMYRNYVSQNIRRFIGKYIVSSRQFIKYDETRKYVVENGFDALIVGSDQVWRPKYNVDIYHSFLDFAEGLDVKRIAYAASFGVDGWEYTEQETERCSCLVRSFDGVSVREQSGVGLCSEYLKIQARQVLDPTMLLGRDDYMKLASSEKKSFKGIGVYFLDANEEKMNFVSDIAAQKGADVYFIGTPDDKGVLPSVESWIKGFADADLIITDSFHGSVFSLMFNKEFYPLVNPSRGAGRFHSLLDMFGLSERILVAPYDSARRPDSINWDNVNARLNELRRESLEFIDSNLDKQ